MSRARLSPSARLDVRDARGSAWSAQAMPRSPTLRLWFDARSHGADLPPIWLVRGHASDALRDDLGGTSVRERTAARLTPLSFETAPEYVDVRASTTLARDAPYTLVWSTPEGLASSALRTADDAQAGAALLASFPAQGASDVGTDQAFVLWLFDGAVALADDAPPVLVHDGRASPLSLSPARCARLGFEEGSCIAAELPAGLAPDARYEAVLPPGTRDARGAPLRDTTLTFETSSVTRSAPPALQPLGCAPDEQADGSVCIRGDDGSVSLRARTQRAAIASFTGCGARQAEVSVLSEITLSFTRTDPAPCRGVLRLSNGADERVDFGVAVPRAPALATVSIAEVRADPLGAEPDQEYVELLNFGDSTVALDGFVLARDGEMHGVALDDGASLAAGERILAVAPGFVARAREDDDSGDSQPAASVRLVRLASALSLSSSGTALALRDAAGRRVSGSPALASEEEGACIARRSTDPRSDARAAFEVDPALRCTPGTATAFP